jgi:hypothetical protein
VHCLLSADRDGSSLDASATNSSSTSSMPSYVSSISTTRSASSARTA